MRERTFWVVEWRFDAKDSWKVDSISRKATTAQRRVHTYARRGSACEFKITEYVPKESR